jgi:hypothetical protein
MLKRHSQSVPPEPPLRPNTKRTGERSEAAFLYQASQRHFAICKPWGDSERYDFILDNRPQPDLHLFRVQIKCTDCLRERNRKKRHFDHVRTAALAIERSTSNLLCFSPRGL